MKKYVLEVAEEDEGELLWYEINYSIMLSALDVRQVHHIEQALRDKKEIRLIKINTKNLRKAEELERN